MEKDTNTAIDKLVFANYLHIIHEARAIYPEPGDSEDAMLCLVVLVHVLLRARKFNYKEKLDTLGISKFRCIETLIIDSGLNTVDFIYTLVDKMNYKFSTSSIFHMLELTGNVDDKIVDIICSLLSADLVPFNDICLIKLVRESAQRDLIIKRMLCETSICDSFSICGELINDFHVNDDKPIAVYIKELFDEDHIKDIDGSVGDMVKKLEFIDKDAQGGLLNDLISAWDLNKNGKCKNNYQHSNMFKIDTDNTNCDDDLEDDDNDGNDDEDEDYSPEGSPQKESDEESDAESGEESVDESENRGGGSNDDEDKKTSKKKAKGEAKSDHTNIKKRKLIAKK
jgi:hypothetical protein